MSERPYGSASASSVGKSWFEQASTPVHSFQLLKLVLSPPAPSWKGKCLTASYLPCLQMLHFSWSGGAKTQRQGSNPPFLPGLQKESSLAPHSCLLSASNGMLLGCSPSPGSPWPCFFNLSGSALALPAPFLLCCPVSHLDWPAAQLLTALRPHPSAPCSYSLWLLGHRSPQPSQQVFRFTAWPKLQAAHQPWRTSKRNTNKTTICSATQSAIYRSKKSLLAHTKVLMSLEQDQGFILALIMGKES